MTIAYKHHFAEFCERINYDTVVYIQETGEILGLKDLRFPTREAPEKCWLMIDFDQIPTDHSQVFYGCNLVLGNQTIICSGSVNLLDIGGKHVVIVFFEPRINTFRDNQVPRFFWKNTDTLYLGNSDYVPTENGLLHTMVGYTDEQLFSADFLYEIRTSDEAVFHKGVCFWNQMGKVLVENATILIKLEKFPYYSFDNEMLGAIICYQPIHQAGTNAGSLDELSQTVNQGLVNRLLSSANIFIAIQTVDLDPKIENFSDNLTGLGYDLEKVRSGQISLRDIIYPGDYDRYMREVKEELHLKKQSFSTAVRILTVKNEVIPAKLYFTPLLGEKGRIVKIGVLIDCFDDSAEKSIHFDKLLAATNQMHVVYTVRKLADPDRYDILTENFHQFSFNAADILSRRLRFKDLIFPDDRELYEKAIREVQEHKTLQSIVEYRLVTRKKMIYWIKETMFSAVLHGVEYLESGLINVTSTKTAFETLKQMAQNENPEAPIAKMIPASFNFATVLKYVNLNDMLHRFADSLGVDVAVFNSNDVNLTEPTGHREAVDLILKQLVDYTSFAGNDHITGLYDNLFFRVFPIVTGRHRIGTLLCFALVKDLPSGSHSRLFDDRTRMFRTIRNADTLSIDRFGPMIADNIATIIFAASVALMQIQSSSNFEGDLTRQRLSHEIILDLLNIANAADDIEQCFNLMMPKIAEAMKLTRTSLFRYREATDEYGLEYEWFVESEISRKTLYQHTKKGESFLTNWDYVKNVSFAVNTDMMLPDKKFYREFARAIVSVRLSNKGKVFGFLNFVDNFAPRTWTTDEIMFFEDIGFIMSSVIERDLNKNLISHHFKEYLRSIESMPAAIAILDHSTNQCSYTNQKFKELIQGSNNAENGQPGLEECILQIQETDASETEEKEVHFPNSDRWYLISKSNISFESQSDMIMYILTDITLQKKNRELMASLAFTDVLTGLPNRLKFELDLKETYDADQYRICHDFICIFNIDNFKMINNTFGYSIGDGLLKNLGRQLHLMSDLSYRIYRFGGDEFGILVSGDPQIHVYEFANRIMNLFEKPFHIDGYETTCTASLGLVYLSESDKDVNDLIRKANLSLQDAKASGKNRFVIFDVSLKKLKEDTLSLERALKMAIDAGCEEFEVFYQPIVSAKTGKIISAEALVRWFSKDFGLISPIQFIPLAESSGLIVPLGKFILNSACKEVKKWLDYGYDIMVAVNFSVIQALQSDLIGTITKTLNTYRVPPKNLTFEITESLAINDINKVIDILTAVRATGIKIAMDDFGTGFSSLNHLRKLPLDIVKIDRSFIFNIEYDPYTISFVDTIAKFCHMKNAEVCCEGVENESQKNLLLGIEVDTLQGYLFGKPCPADDFWKLLLNNH